MKGKNLTRKQRRKQERKAKKAKKQAYYLSRKKGQPSNSPAGAVTQSNTGRRENNEDDEYRDDELDYVDAPNDEGPIKTASLSKTESHSPAAKKRKKEAKHDKKEFNAKKKRLLAENKKEDRIIKSLEKKMGLNKRKKKKNTLPQSFINDGLDFILEVVDNTQNAFFEDSHEDVSLGKRKKDVDKGDDDALHVDDDDSDSNMDDQDEAEEGDEEEPLDEDEDEVSLPEEDSGDDPEMPDEEEQEGEDEMDEDEDNQEDENEETTENAGEEKEKEEEVPSRRFQMLHQSKSDDAVAPLKRQLKGLFNRLSEANMQPIANQIEEMYMQNSRNTMNELITSLLLASIVSPSPIPDRLLMDQAMLLALLHANVGEEVGAHFLKELVTKFDSLWKERLQSSQQEEGRKELNNAMLFLTYMFLFKIIHSLLIFDLLQFIIDGLTLENDVDLIVSVLKTAGFNLRKEDSVSLRDVILKLQSKMASSELRNQSRTIFLMDIVHAVQNNNTHKIPNYDPSVVTHAQKMICTYLHEGKHINHLHISLSDLLQADTRGKWWIVGSSWTASDTLQAAKDDAAKETMPIETNVSSKVLELARKQRMNSDVRKTIFCMIMTSEDFMDCFEKLVRLGLRNHRDVVLVSLDCCLQEKAYNPFYSHLLQKLCQCDRHYQMALKFSLWDKFKEIRSMKPMQSSNLSRLLVHLFVTDALPISLLKAFHFSEMDKTLVHFLKGMFVHLFLEASEECLRQVFRRIAHSPKLHLLREGLKLFLRHFLLNSKQPIAEGEQDKARIEESVKLVEEVLSSDRKAMF